VADQLLDFPFAEFTVGQRQIGDFLESLENLAAF
jgi:hypothetical protein